MVNKINQANNTFEVRDLRQKDKFFLDNDFFNGYVRILGTNALGIYCSLARHADKQQKSFPSQKSIAEELGLSEPTINEWIKVLEYFCIIKKQRIGKQCTNRYWLLDKKEWRKDFDVILNELSSQDKVNLNNLSSGDIKQFKFTTKTVLVHNLNSLSSIVTINNSNNKQMKGIAANAADKPKKINSLVGKKNNKKKIKEKELRPPADLSQDKNIHVRRIGMFAEFQGITFSNAQTQKEFIVRYARPATSLNSYSDERIMKTMIYLQEHAKFIDRFTLETVLKYIDFDLDGLSKKSNKTTSPGVIRG